MATTNKDRTLGTALVINGGRKPIECDWCGNLIQFGEQYAADFINMCMKCDKMLPCGTGDCADPVLDNHNYCAKHQDESGESCMCGKEKHI